METLNLSIVGSLTSILGLVVTIVTFVYVLIFKKAARKAVDQLRADFMRFDAGVEITSAIAAMEEIKRLHREGAWSILPERYSALRKHLISIKGVDPSMLAEEQTVLQGAMQQFLIMEQEVEKALLRKEDPEDVPRYNSIVSKQIDRLQDILVDRRNKLGR
jgi:hypothetical protein